MSTVRPSPDFSSSASAPDDGLALGAVDMGAAVDDGLRRIDRAVAEGFAVVILPRGVFRACPACPSSRDSPSSRHDSRARRHRPASARSASTASAGGQELQPWLVNSSTTPDGFLISPATAGAAKARQHRRRASADKSLLSMGVPVPRRYDRLFLLVAGMLARIAATTGSHVAVKICDRNDDDRPDAESPAVGQRDCRRRVRRRDRAARTAGCRRS